MRVRSLGRELALKYLYSSAVARSRSMDDFTEFAADQEGRGEAREFAGELVRGVFAKFDELADRIEGAARNWSWKRMPVIDRCILQLGAYELLHRPDIPTTVTINEAVELAKRYGSKNSAGFVNGVLDTIARAADAAAPPATGD